ncbi:MAG: hypothetical protein NT079_02685 [Candidatus Omnitrophica bacterium]|nr:hypothetical protein [Candidatus Omnitrophota bacterium]
MRRKILWILVAAIVLATAGTIIGLRQQCMSKCMAEFKGVYPDVACKYECSFFNKFKQPAKRP